MEGNDSNKSNEHMESNKCNDGDNKGKKAIAKAMKVWRATKGDECIMSAKGGNGENEVDDNE